MWYYTTNEKDKESYFGYGRIKKKTHTPYFMRKIIGKNPIQYNNKSEKIITERKNAKKSKQKSEIFAVKSKETI